MPERLLVVDDNKVNRLLIARMLEMQGHAVALAHNGREAMDLLRAGRIALMILDLEMPELDGFSVLEQLVADPELREVPVIVASSLEGVPDHGDEDHQCRGDGQRGGDQAGQAAGGACRRAALSARWAAPVL